MLVAASMATAGFETKRTAERARQGFITVTELADTLTRDHNVPFKTSHSIASRFVAESSKRPSDPPARILREVSERMLCRAIGFTDAALADVLSPEHFVRVRKTPGGPAPEESARAIARSRASLLADTDWHGKGIERLRAAAGDLKAAAAAL
jgi:argininosuccinate lyase